MGFNTVYRFLSEIFPQVDARLLKAVAIEHSKDADAAANAVLTEILPYWTKQSVTSSSLPGDQSAPYSTSNDQNAPISTLKYQSAPNSTSKDQSLRDLSDGDGDADAAANAVLTEILPYWTKQSVTSSSLPGNQSAPYSTSNDQNAPNSTSKDQSAPNSTSKDQSAPNSTAKDQSLRDLSDGDGEHEEISSLSRRRRIVVRKRNKNAGTSPEPGAISSGNVPNSDSTHMHCADSASLSKALDASTNLHFFDANDGSNQLFGNNESEEVILLGKTEESSNEVGSNKVSVVIPNIMMNDVDLTGGCAYTESGESDSLDNGQDFNVKVGPELNTLVMSAPLTHENDVVNGHLTDGKDSDGSLGTDLVKSISGKCQEEESCSECPVVVAENPVAQLVPSSVQELMLDASESDLQSDIVSGTSSTDCKKADASGSLDLKSKKENSISEKGAIEDELTVNTVITRSGQICRIDLLEEIIEDAKNNKRTLFLAMESVMNMMKEVELQEKAAEEAKIEAARGGLDILIKVEELKHMLSHAKAANDMHAGEVYGEKAILATEARELQTRLLSLSEERDKSLAILDEMREVLEGRLAAAEELRKAAEEEKLGKEKSARSYLAELEALMEKVVKESKILQQEAEENSKLREFLMDRGHVVDSLQGEISVICQDVRLLKEKFDERVPLSQSISSSQTTCILASSGSSSVKSLASLHAEQGLSSETALVGASPTPTIDVQSPKSSLGDERSGADRRELLDDGWDFFDKDTELYGRKL